MRKSYCLMTVVLLAMITGLILFSFYGIGTSDGHRFLNHGWEYSWGDEDAKDTGKDRQWLPMQAFKQPEGRNGQNYLWLRVPLPQGVDKDPTLFMKYVHQTFEIYMDGALLYKYGELPAPPEERFRPWLPFHFVSLPDNAPGKMLCFRIYSAAPSIGITGVVEYGSMLGLFKQKNMIDFLRVSSASLMLVAGILALFMWFYHRRESMYLAFASNALWSAAAVIASTYSIFLFYQNPDFWNYWIIFTIIGWKIFWLQLLVYIVEEKYRRAVQRLVWLTVCFSCLQFIAAIVNPSWSQNIIMTHTLYSIVCYLLVMYFCRLQLQHNREAQLYAGGISIWIVTSILDCLSVVGVIYMPLLISWVGQFAEVGGLAVILILRYAAVHRRLRNYSEDLEKFNRNLEDMVEERTKELSIQNTCLEQLFDNSPNAMVMLDLHYRIIKINPAFEMLFGYGAQEVIGQELDKLLRIPEGTAQEYILNVEHLEQGIHLDTVRYHKDGSLLTVAMTAYPFITVNNQLGVYAAYRDISKQVIAERILKDSERKYRLLAENMEDVIWLLNFDKQILYFSPSIEKLLGFKLEEYLKMPQQEQISYHLQSAIDKVIDNYQQGEHHKLSVLLEEERWSKEGKLVWIESSISIAYDEDGELLGVLGITRNITPRKCTEKLLSSAYERKRRNQFFTNILEGLLLSEQDIYAQARQMRINFPQSFAMCFCSIDDGKNNADHEQQDMLLDQMVDLLNRQDNIVAWNATDGIGVICNLLLANCRQTELEAAENCLKLLSDAFPAIIFHIGLAEYSDSLTEFSNRFRHARSAARIGRHRYGSNYVQRYEECGVYEVFDNFAGTQEAEKFVQRILGSLYQYDQNNGTELMETLVHILSRASLKEIAEIMFIHPKTITSRKQRIEKVLQLSLDSFEDRMVLGAALQIDKMLKSRT
jgi:PAS domain S-box-containing protein